MISEITRYHEAGHGVGTEKLGIGLEERGIEINSDDDACTYVKQPANVASLDMDYLLRRAAVKLAGPVAQFIHEKRSVSPEALGEDHRTFQDLEEARQILRKYLMNGGTLNELEVERQLCDALYIAYNLVTTHWDEVEAVVQASMANGKVSAETVRSIAKPIADLDPYLGSSNKED